MLTLAFRGLRPVSQVYEEPRQSIPPLDPLCISTVYRLERFHAKKREKEEQKRGGPWLPLSQSEGTLFCHLFCDYLLSLAASGILAIERICEDP
ncbi:hypothetical protein Nepgr_016802 [Nepenthes gracilis]|uniref:Uncharacterized protein n=1 Tax=Nepenthes gracilis TaxID=150966 RepID=A0AAD3SRB5_NEPGR|nr:hypothetical protein Nepgr_016802 [Nepenthes gracilis]